LIFIGCEIIFKACLFLKNEIQYLVFRVKFWFEIKRENERIQNDFSDCFEHKKICKNIKSGKDFEKIKHVSESKNEEQQTEEQQPEEQQPEEQKMEEELNTSNIFD
jgi:hypothetical protein